MKRLLIAFLAVSAVLNFSFAQDLEALKNEKTAKEAELAPLKTQLEELTAKVTGLEGDIATLTDQITPYPRWSTGAFGTVGLNLSNFNNWLSKEQPNTSATTIGFTMNGFANLDQKKYFWRNGANLNLAWLKFDDKDNPDDIDDFQVATDAFNITSLFGYKLNDKWAISALGEYRTAVLEERFNNPGYLDLGVGATWTPIKDLVVVFHPLNYNFVFADEEFDYTSSLGCKIVADYTAKITENISWKSNLSTFISYEDASNLTNWTWVNSFSTAVKGIGIGLDVGLRGNKQEAFNLLNTNPDITDIKDYDGDNPFQTYWVLGLSYAL